MTDFPIFQEGGLTTSQKMDQITINRLGFLTFGIPTFLCCSEARPQSAGAVMQNPRQLGQPRGYSNSWRVCFMGKLVKIDDLG